MFIQLTGAFPLHRSRVAIGGTWLTVCSDQWTCSQVNLLVWFGKQDINNDIDLPYHMTSSSFCLFCQLRSTLQLATLLHFITDLWTIQGVFHSKTSGWMEKEPDLYSTDSGKHTLKAYLLCLFQSPWEKKTSWKIWWLYILWDHRSWSGNWPRGK